MIDHEIKQAKMGKEAYIMIKVNNLEDQVMIDKLYEASKSGVKIDMLVRSICGLIPGIEGISENIRVIRIIDRFLEHARIFIFHNDGDQKIFMGSADWMKRNLYNRIEVVFPLYEKQPREEIQKMIYLQLNDTVKGRKLDQHHNNTLRSTSALKAKTKIRSQISFYEWLKQREGLG